MTQPLDYASGQPHVARPRLPVWVINIGLSVLLLALWPLNAVLEHGMDPYYLRIVILVGMNIVLAVSLNLINGITGQFSLGHAGFMALGAYLTGSSVIAFEPQEQQPFVVLLFYVTHLVFLGILCTAVFSLALLWRYAQRFHRFLPAIFVAAVLGWFILHLALGHSVEGFLIFRILGFLLKALYGACYFCFVHGSPAAAAISKIIPAILRQPITLLITLFFGGVLAALAGLAVGIPALRLRGDYLAIATLGFGEIIYVIINATENIGKFEIGGASGLHGIPIHTNFFWTFLVVVVCVVTVWRLAYSTKGLAFRAVREDEIAATAMGVDTTYYKVAAFAIGAFFAGVAGGVFATYDGNLAPESFRFNRSIEIVVMVVLGGSGSITGCILAAIVLTFAPEFLRFFADWRMVIYSVVLIATMLLRPEGLMGNREIWWTRKRLKTLGSEAPNG